MRVSPHRGGKWRKEWEISENVTSYHLYERSD